VAAFHSEAVSLRARENVLRAIEQLLLEFMGRLGAHETAAQAIARQGLNRRVIRRQALEFLANLPKHCPGDDAARRAWIETARLACKSLMLPCPPRQTISQFFRTPTDRAWARGLRVRDEGGLPCSTVHEAKGKQFDAVLVVIPPDRAPGNRTSEFFAAWENRAELEAKRVVYVAVTRARRLIMLAVPVTYTPRCQTILELAQVSFELCPPLG